MHQARKLLEAAIQNSEGSQTITLSRADALELASYMKQLEEQTALQRQIRSE